MSSTKPRASWIKKNQKESLLIREISQLLQQASLDDPKLREFSISRVSLSDDKGHCYVFFFNEENDPDKFKEYLHHLKLYKPSLRSALAKEIKGRYVPEIVFRYDEQYTKQRKLEEVLHKIKSELDEE